MYSANCQTRPLGQRPIKRCAGYRASCTIHPIVAYMWHATAWQLPSPLGVTPSCTRRMSKNNCRSSGAEAHASEVPTGHVRNCSVSSLTVGSAEWWSTRPKTELPRVAKSLASWFAENSQVARKPTCRNYS